MCTTSNNKHKMFSTITPFFPSLNIPPVTFIFSYGHHLLVNAWSLKLIWPITTSLCVPCMAMWKHLTSSLWMNVVDFIFWILHIRNLPTLFVLIPLCLPCTPSTENAHLSTDYENTYGDCTNFSVDYAHNFDVATLALGSRPRQGLTRVWAKKEARKSHLMLLGM
jgi:hypothetical protein